MATLLDPVPFILLFSAASSLVVTLITWQRRARPAAMPLAALGLAATFWAVCYFFEYISENSAAKFFWRNLKYPAVVIIPLALAVFILRFSGWQHWPSRRTLAILLIIPALTIGMVFTNPWHNAFWQSYDIIQHAQYTELRYTRGWWFWLHAIYSYGLIVYAIIQAMTMWGNTWRVYRQQFALLTIGILLPLIANILSVANVQPWPGLDLSPIAFGLTALFMLAAARLNKFLNVIPLAHATLVEQMRDGVLVVDNERRILEINRAATQIFGIEKREMIGKITTRLDHPGMRLLDNTLTGRTAHHEFPVGEGENTSWYEVRISAIRPNDDEIAGYMAIWHNITDRKLIERELRHTATHDILTGVYNRVFFEDAMHHNRYTFRWPVTVISLDLDNTKTTNDTLGHAAGDKLLSEMATLLRKTFRQDDLVARIGGDEFAVLAMQADNEAANLLLHRLAEAAAQYNAAAQHLPIQYSAGYAVAYYADELSAAFNKADDRMYAEKNIHKSQQ